MGSNVPGFYSWFQRKRLPLFVESLINCDLDRAPIGSKFYNNRLEVLHKLQNKFVTEGEITHDVCAINKALQEWTESYHKEALKALYGHGRYRLAPGYDQFYVDPTKWFKWGQEKRQHHIEAFQMYFPAPSDLYKKPSNAGMKAKRNLEETQLNLKFLLIHLTTTILTLHMSQREIAAL